MKIRHRAGSYLRAKTGPQNQEKAASMVQTDGVCNPRWGVRGYYCRGARPLTCVGGCSEEGGAGLTALRHHCVEKRPSHQQAPRKYLTEARKALPPGKRPASVLVPTLVVRNAGGPEKGLGTLGPT